MLPALLSFDPDVTDADREKVDSMLLALIVHQNNSEAYWNFITEFLPEIEQLDDDDIISDSGKGLFSRIVSAIRRIFSGVDEKKYHISRYVESGVYNQARSNNWC